MTAAPTDLADTCVHSSSPVAFVGVDAACVSVAGPSDEKAVMCNRSGRLLQLSTVAGAV